MKFNLSLKFFQKKRAHDVLMRGEHEYMNPTKHWMLGLLAAVCTLLSGIAFIAYDFYDQLGTTEIDFVPAEQPTMYRDREVIQMSNVYKVKESTFNILRENAKEPVVEESIPEVKKVADINESDVEPALEEEVPPLAETLIEQ